MTDEKEPPKVHIPPDARATLQRAIVRSEIADGIRKPPRLPWWRRWAAKADR